MREPDIALVILASGLSKRFGINNKLIASFKGKPLIQHIIDSCKPMNFGGRFAVIPTRSCALRDLLLDNDFTLIENDKPLLGRVHSIKLAAQFIKKKRYQNMCLVLGDMPFVKTLDLKNIIQNIGDNDKAICCYKNTLMPPAIFRNNVIKTLITSNYQFSPKALFKHENYYKYNILKKTALDIDTIEELRELS